MTYLGTVATRTDAAGSGRFSGQFSHPLAPTSWVVATATDAQGNTSELSGCRLLVAGLSVPVITETIQVTDTVVPNGPGGVVVVPTIVERIMVTDRVEARPPLVVPTVQERITVTDGVRPEVATIRLTGEPTVLGQRSKITTTTYTASNNGTGPVSVTALAATGAPVWLIVGAPTLPRTLAVGESLTFQVEFTPRDVGTVTTTISATFEANATQGTASLEVTGSVRGSTGGGGCGVAHDRPASPLAAWPLALALLILLLRRRRPDPR